MTKTTNIHVHEYKCTLICDGVTTTREEKENSREKQEKERDMYIMYARTSFEPRDKISEDLILSNLFP